MDRFDAGVILASFTFTIDPLYFYGAGTVALVTVAFLGTRPLLRKRKARKHARLLASTLAQEQEEVAAKKKNRDDSLALFPEPWLTIYNECGKMYGTGQEVCVSRGIMLNAWLSQANEPLPKLSWKAIRKLATMIACSTSNTDKDFIRAAETLSPYLEIGANKKTGHRSLHRQTANQHLAKHLPKPWYDFALELINYPSSYSLFLDKTCWFKKDKRKQHPCCKIPLTAEQAIVFAEAVGKDSEEIKSYARGLIDFVTLKSEEQPSALKREANKQRQAAMEKRAEENKHYHCHRCDHPRKLHDGECVSCGETDEPDEGPSKTHELYGTKGHAAQALTCKTHSWDIGEDGKCPICEYQKKTLKERHHLS